MKEKEIYSYAVSTISVMMTPKNIIVKVYCALAAKRANHIWGPLNTA